MIPTSKEAMIPVLECLKKAPKTSMELRQSIIEQFGITEEEQAERQPKGTSYVYVNRLGWAITGLKKFDYIQSPERGLWEITIAGTDALKNPPKKIIADPRPVEDDNIVPQNTGEPEEDLNDYIDIITENYKKMYALLKKDLLKTLKELKGDQFERVIGDLFIKMGYNAQVTQYTRDGGIDVMASEDRLGLNKIFIQTKCYTDKLVDSPEIQKFIGAATSNTGKLQSAKCVFVTTTEFTKPAIDEASKIPVRLINGNELVELMIEYKLGIIQDSDFDIYRLNQNYFSDELDKTQT